MAGTTLDLPFPLSVNAMFADGRTRRRKSDRYQQWIAAAQVAALSQRAKPVKGPVVLEYAVQAQKDRRRRDLGNLEKGVTDLLVSLGLIESDCWRTVQKIILYWSAEVEGIRATIIPCERYF